MLYLHIIAVIVGALLIADCLVRVEKRQDRGLNIAFTIMLMGATGLHINDIVKLIGGI